MTRREKILLMYLGLAGVLFVISRTSTGQATSSALLDKIGRLIAGHEGDRLTVYQDEGGLWTIGKGHLVKPGERFHPYGPVKTITQAESDALFVEDTAIARNAVANKVMKPLTDNQRAALVSLVFNIGAGAFSTSTLLRKLNAGDYTGAADQFLVWKNVKGKESAGLLKRRNSERQLFLA